MTEYNCNKCKDRNWIIECQCGNCNELIFLANRYYNKLKYKHGHNFKNKNGDKSARWNGGVKINDKNYIFTYSPDHPSKYTGNYVPTHRLIYEHYLKILMDEDVYIPSNYDIHHIDKNPSNNALINLELVLHKEHKFKHRSDYSDRTCFLCGLNKTGNNANGRPNWFKYGNDKFICKLCYNKIYREKNKKVS